MAISFHFFAYFIIKDISWSFNRRTDKFYRSDGQPTGRGFEPLVSHLAGVHICAVEQMCPVLAILVWVILGRCIKKSRLASIARVRGIFSTDRRLNFFLILPPCW